MFHVFWCFFFHFLLFFGGLMSASFDPKLAYSAGMFCIKERRSVVALERIAYVLFGALLLRQMSSRLTRHGATEKMSLRKHRPYWKCSLAGIHKEGQWPRPSASRSVMLKHLVWRRRIFVFIKMSLGWDSDFEVISTVKESCRKISTIWALLIPFYKRLTHLFSLRSVY